MLNLLQGGPDNHHNDTRPLDQPRDRRPLPGAPALQTAAVGDDVATRMGQDREVLGEAVERQPHLLRRRGRHHHVEAAAQLLSVLQEGVPVGRGRDVGLALQRHREADHTRGDLETEARGQVTARRIALDDDRRGALPRPDRTQGAGRGGDTGGALDAAERQQRHPLSSPRRKPAAGPGCHSPPPAPAWPPRRTAAATR